MAKQRLWDDADRAEEREAATALADYLTYLDGDLAVHLQVCCYFLGNHVRPVARDRLPPCRGHECQADPARRHAA